MRRNANEISGSNDGATSLTATKSLRFFPLFHNPALLRAAGTEDLGITGFKVLGPSDSLQGKLSLQMKLQPWEKQPWTPTTQPPRVTFNYTKTASGRTGPEAADFKQPIFAKMLPFPQNSTWGLHKVCGLIVLWPRLWEGVS